jgi:outer membrane lipoprotein SlyB
MNTPVTIPTRTPMHPLMVIVSICIIMVCGLSAAALLGWLPSSTGGNANAVADNKDLALAGQPALADPGKPLPAPVISRAAPVVQEPAPEVAALPAPAVCSNCGVISSVTHVDVRGEGGAMGTAGGAIVGGLLGNQVGSGNGRKLATLAGAVGGAVAGNQIEGNMRTTRRYNIVVRLNNGKTRTFHQAQEPAWHTGEHVRIVNGAIHAD